MITPAVAKVSLIFFFILISIFIIMPLVTILKTKNGRVFRFQYMIYVLSIYFYYIISIIFFIFLPGLHNILIIILLSVAFNMNVEYTIQRLFDTNKSKYLAFLYLIPPFFIILNIYLFFQESIYGINKYDTSINFYKLLEGKINYDIKPKEYSRGFEYICKKYIIKNIEVLIRTEDFKYSILIKKNDELKIKEDIEILTCPGTFIEDIEYFYYRKINKKELMLWAKNVA